VPGAATPLRADELWKIDPGAAHRNALPKQRFPLLRASRHGAVSANDSVPRSVRELPCTPLRLDRGRDRRRTRLELRGVTEDVKDHLYRFHPDIDLAAAWVLRVCAWRTVGVTAAVAPG
jgi:hypothetical protein